MTRPRRPLPQALAAGVGAALAASITAAAVPPPTPPQTAPPLPAPAAGMAPYRDRIIDPDRLPPLQPDEDDEADGDGPLRSFHAELNLRRNERGSEHYEEHGLSAGGFWESATLGTFSLDATVFSSDRQRREGRGGLGGSGTLWQRSLFLDSGPIDGGWRVDNGLGVLNTPSLPLQRNQYRFYLPTSPFAGASSEWSLDRGRVQLQGALGRAGLYTGTRAVGFDVADGAVGALGAQWTWAPQWQAAVAALATHGRIRPDNQGEATLQPGNSNAVFAASAWTGDNDSAQFNLLSSDGDRRRAVGGWLDASAQRGRYTHNYGAFRLGEGLEWGALPINNDVQGGYYRLAYRYGRWQWNAGIDGFDSLSGAGFNGAYGTGYARYQATNTLGYGGSISLRQATSSSTSHAMQLFADKRTPWGQTRLQLDQASSSASDSWQLGVDHALALRQGARLSASLAYGGESFVGESSSHTTVAALFGGRDLTDRLSVDGSARWTHGAGLGALRGTDINLGVSWKLTTHWLLAGSVYQNQGSRRSPFILDPLVTDLPFISLPRDRSVFLSLQYERNAGRPQAVMGGAPGAATGGVSGSVYLDDNDDGARAASEQPAANVTVVLDGRYSVRTDASGNFQFPRVAVGRHTLAVVPDNLPLPWFVDETPQLVEVTVRATARVDVGAHRRR